MSSSYECPTNKYGTSVRHSFSLAVYATTVVYTQSAQAWIAVVAVVAASTMVSNPVYAPGGSCGAVETAESLDMAVLLHLLHRTERRNLSFSKASTPPIFLSSITLRQRTSHYIG